MNSLDFVKLLAFSLKYNGKYIHPMYFQDCHQVQRTNSNSPTRIIQITLNQIKFNIVKEKRQITYYFIKHKFQKFSALHVNLISYVKEFQCFLSVYFQQFSVFSSVQFTITSWKIIEKKSVMAPNYLNEKKMKLKEEFDFIL